MRITVNYTVYKHSEEATIWSKIAGALATLGIILILLEAYGIIELFSLLAKNGIFASLLKSDLGGILTIVGAVVFHISLIAFCRRQEQKCDVRDYVKSLTGDDLTNEQVKQIIKKLREKNKKNAKADRD